MATFRINKNKNYTTMSNYHLKDSNLSLKAKGLLSMMLSLPDNWDYSVRGLAEICIETKDTINGILKELENNNYLVRKRIYSNGKISDWEYNIYECNDLYPKNQDIENQDIGFYDINKITKELNTKEEKENIKRNIFEHYESTFGRTLNQMEYETMNSWLKDKTEDEIKLAIDDTAKLNIDNVKYVGKVLYSNKRKVKVRPKWMDEEIINEEITNEEDFKDFQNFIQEFKS